MEIFRYTQAELDYLRARDEILGRAIDRIGVIERPVHRDIFSALVSSIVAQQISGAAARTVWNRLEARLGAITPETVHATAVEDIQQCGVSMRKATYIKGIGEAVVSGALDLAALHDLPDEDVIARLSSLHGIGVWTAEMVLIFAMQRPDVVSWGDLGIRRGMMRLYGLETLDRPTFEHYRQRYSPYGSIASLYLWRIAAGE